MPVPKSPWPCRTCSREPSEGRPLSRSWSGTTCRSSRSPVRHRRGPPRLSRRRQEIRQPRRRTDADIEQFASERHHGDQLLQNVYDPSDAKIGEISDVLVSKDGKIDAFIVAVGGFLGVGEKDVAVPFDAVRATEKDGKSYLTMNATKDGLQKAHGYKFDRAEATWVPA